MGSGGGLDEDWTPGACDEKKSLQHCNFFYSLLWLVKQDSAARYKSVGGITRRQAVNKTTRNTVSLTYFDMKISGRKRETRFRAVDDRYPSR